MLKHPRKKGIVLSAIITAMLVTSIAIPTEIGYCDESRVETYSDSPQQSDSDIKDIGVHNKLQDSENTNKTDELSRSKTANDTKYDPRNQSWYKNNITVKDQEDTGLCWAVAATTAAELSYTKKYSTKVQFSPVHLGYFFYNRVNDPLGNTWYDLNKVTDGTNYSMAGGNNYLTYQALASWTGMATESLAPFTLAGKTLPENTAYANTAILENADLVDTKDEVKEAVSANGNTIVSLYYDEEYYNDETGAIYCEEENSSNHSVVIVGWDDTYSRENFNEDYRPEEDGAWIVQNSWGKEWGDDGFIYVSYEDASLENAITLDMEKASDYDYNYQYDGNAAYSSFVLFENEKGANIFTVPKDGKTHHLDAVGFTSFIKDSNYIGDDVEYNIEVYTNLKNAKDPTSGTKECSFKTTVGKEGYHTVSLEGKTKDGIILDAGSKYSIVITMSEDTKFGAEYSELSLSWVNFTSDTEKEQSYWYNSETNEWEDGYDYSSPFCLRIKGLVNAETVQLSAPSSFTATLNGYHGVELKWSKVSGATGYRIRYKKSTESWDGDVYEQLMAFSTSTSFKSTDLKSGVKYDFLIEPYKKINGVRYYGDKTKTCSMYTLKKLSNVKVKKSSTNYVKASWTNIPGESGYQIAKSSYSTKKFSTVKTVSSKYSYAKIKVTKNKTYYYKVRAYKKSGSKTTYGPWSSVVKYKLK